MLLVFVIILSSSLNVCFCAEIKRKSADLGKTLEVLIETKCLRNANYDALIDLQVAIMNLSFCLPAEAHSTTDDEAYNKICNIYPGDGYKCVKTFMNKVDPCLDLEEKYIERAILSIYNTSAQKYCKDGEEAFMDRIKEIRGARCTKSNSLSIAIDFCIPKVISGDMILDPSFIFRKSYFCRKLVDAKNCIVEDLTRHCVENSLARFMIDGFEPYLNWCTDHMFTDD